MIDAKEPCDRRDRWTYRMRHGGRAVGSDVASSGGEMM